jgi:hypothetical protein
MSELIIYPQLKEITVKVGFRADYIDYDETVEDIMPFCNFKHYNKGQILNAIGKIKSGKCDSGYGYIVFDKEIEEALIFDINLFE